MKAFLVYDLIVVNSQELLPSIQFDGIISLDNKAMYSITSKMGARGRNSGDSWTMQGVSYGIRQQC